MGQSQTEHEYNLAHNSFNFFHTRNLQQMSTTTKLGDEFLRIPKLDVSGSNWVLYKERFFWALDARSILDHVDGTGKEPADPVPETARTSERLSDEEKPLDVEWKKETKKNGSRAT